MGNRKAKPHEALVFVYKYSPPIPSAVFDSG